MVPPVIKTRSRIIPRIYAYTTPEIAAHNGWTKIGYTEQDVETRIKQQTQTAGVQYVHEWDGPAVFDDTGALFRDSDFHGYLKKLGIQRKAGTEWFCIDGPGSKKHYIDFRENHGTLLVMDTVVPYFLRDEQKCAVEKTKDYFRVHENGEFLWNAKPRFGKTLTVYHLCQKLGFKKILILTNRPAIGNSWYEDYVKFFGQESGLLFVSDTEALKSKPYVLSRDEYLKALKQPGGKDKGLIRFVSLQDMKGSVHFGGAHPKLEDVANLSWDILVIDEAHEGVDTQKSDVAFHQITRKYTLHLSGTPFKSIAREKFPDQAIFSWTYADEQKAKRDWHGAEHENPYAVLPRLNMYTYQMSEIVKDVLSKGIEIDGEQEEYAFDLNLFFETKDGVFVHEESVDKFLNALTMQKKYPFSTEELRNELKHTFWLLNRVDSAKALARKLSIHPVFREYEIILAAGDGKLNDEDSAKTAFHTVKNAIETYDKTITLSVGQLTTGVTIPEWTAVLILSSIKSPELYMQAAFRAQNPCVFREQVISSGNNTQLGFYRKENAYVFDFDPARTLTIFEKFANDLYFETSGGRGDLESRTENIKELLNFFPVIGEDENGVMVELDAARVLSIPRRIKAHEVVRRGFMSDFLFQNISRLFHAPKGILSMIDGLPSANGKDGLRTGVDENTAGLLSLDEDGNISLSEDDIEAQTKGLLGGKIYSTVDTAKETVARLIDKPQDGATHLAHLEKEIAASYADAIVTPLLEAASQKYGTDLSASSRKKLESRLKTSVTAQTDKLCAEYAIQSKVLETERHKFLETSDASEEAYINEAYDKLQEEAKDKLKSALKEAADALTQTAAHEVVTVVETQQKEDEKLSFEQKMKEKIRGFSRTFPAFLMAYGNDDVTFETFDAIIPDAVFQEVTGISLSDFHLLRDGGAWLDPETGREEYFEGNIFDTVVFNDAIKEFLSLKQKLSNYFDENSTEDIFDYIPPQKTNQIYTPKHVVAQMVDLLEEENPGVFDLPNITFIDLYMKSGLYITEIVKRLYRSPEMKRLFPDSAERLKHIFTKQVYGLAPTEIIYRIATNYIFGFDSDVRISKNNFRMINALEYAKSGTLKEKLCQLFEQCN